MSPTLTAFKALVRKDIALFLRDRRALVVSVLTPIVVAAAIYFLLLWPVVRLLSRLENRALARR